MTKGRSRRERGFSLAELLSVVFILVLFFTLAIGILNPLVHAATQGQAKLETVQTAAQGFYIIQRDLRMGHAQSTYQCDTSGTTCQVSSAWTSDRPVIAVPTALDSSGNIALSSGSPSWKGFVVYWTSGGKLYRSYQSAAGASQANAQSAVQAANPSTPAAADTFLVGDYSLTATENSNVVTLQMIARSSYGGSANQTTYNSNVVPQN